MDIGISIPTRGPMATVASIRGLAEGAEQMGYRHLAVPDHILVPRSIDSTYPYSANGDFPGAQGGDSMEQFTLLAWLAAVTTKIRLLTSVAVVPHRNPMFMAKSLATTDQLSDGRVVVGCGAGWMREEFEALNITDFDARGRVTDEYIGVMLELWQQDRASFHGEFIDFTDVAADPKPVQRPHPPIWIGGESMPAIRRTVALGDAWYPFGTNPKFRMDTIDTFVARRDKLFAEAERAGRDPASIGLAYNCAFHDERAQEHAGGGRLLFTGTPEQRADDIAALAETGVSTMMINVAAPALTPMLDRMQAFSDDVMPLLA